MKERPDVQALGPDEISDLRDSLSEDACPEMRRYLLYLHDLFMRAELDGIEPRSTLSDLMDAPITYPRATVGGIVMESPRGLYNGWTAAYQKESTT